MIDKRIYGQSKNGNIQCVGIRLEDGSVGEMPMKGSRINKQQLVGKIVVFHNKLINKYYDIKIVAYLKARSPKFIIQYGNKEFTVDSLLIKNCQVGNIIGEQLMKKNKFYKKDSHYIMIIETKGTVHEKLFDGREVEILFNGSEEVIEGIMKSTWSLNKSLSNKFYAQASNYNKTGKNKKLHQVVYGNVKQGNVIDHIDGDTFNNRLDNLREVTKKENAKNKKGAGYPKLDKKTNTWFYEIRIDGYLIRTPMRKSYEECDIDSLITQKYFNYKHREDEWNKINDIDEQYKNSLITLMTEKLFKSKNRPKKFTKNKYEIIDNGKEEFIKVYGKNENIYTYISKKSAWVLDLGRLWLTGGYWNIRIENKDYKLHRVLLNILTKTNHNIQIDHLNQNPNDNRLENLIITTVDGNLSNKNSSGYAVKNKTYEISYVCYWKYICEHKNINKNKRALLKTEQEAKEEVFKRKWLTNYIRPKFKNYEEYLQFEEEYILNKKEDQNMDDYWITTKLPKINEIKIPNFTEKDMDKL